MSIDSGHTNRPEYEFIDSRELAARWAVPETWIRERVRTRCEDPLPHVRFGKYVRFRWGRPWLKRVGEPSCENGQGTANQQTGEQRLQL